MRFLFLDAQNTLNQNDKKPALLNYINHLLRPVPFDGFNNTPVTVRDCFFDPKFEPQTIPEDLVAPEAY